MKRNKIFHDKKNMIDLKDKVIVFVGGTDGMGRIAVEELAKYDSKIFLLGRNPKKAKRVIKEIKSETKNNHISYVTCDLSVQESVRMAAWQVINQTSKIDLLINCAGANIFEHIITDEGYEMSWATNHLGPFLLTNLLLEPLKNAPSARIVNLSSATQSRGRIELDAILNNAPTSHLNRYAQAKLAMIMCTKMLADELKNTNITVNALNPGFINTNLLRNAKGSMRIWIYIQRIFASSPKVGSNRILALATSKSYEGVSGKFVYEDYISEPNQQANNIKLVNTVYSISRAQVGLA